MPGSQRIDGSILLHKHLSPLINSQAQQSTLLIADGGTVAFYGEPKKIKSATVSIFATSICHEMMGLDATIFVF